MLPVSGLRAGPGLGPGPGPGPGLAGAAAARGWELEALETLEANVDDMSPEVGAFVCERLLAAGARDAWLVPATMKKGRQAVVLGALCEPAGTPELLDIVFRETTTLGVRVQPCERVSLRRRVVEVDTRWGRARVKVSGEAGAGGAGVGAGAATVKPEFEDCAALARASGAPLREVSDEARRLALALLRGQAAEGAAAG